jgi:RNA polymerase sigma factor (sigma-70 family)
VTPREKNALITGYVRTVKHLTQTAHATMLEEDYDELVADCLMAVSNAIDDFNPAYGATLDTFVWRYIRQRVSSNFHKSIGRAERREERGFHESNFTDVEYDADRDQSVDPFGANEQDCEIWQESALCAITEPRRKKILTYALDGLTFAEIGRRMGISRERVRQLHADAVRQVRAKMGEK